MTQSVLDALVQPPGNGERLWHLDSLWTFKISSAASGGALSVAEQLLPKGSAPPRHRHTREDEAWCVLDGEVTFFLDDAEYTAAPGAWVFGPRGRAHTFRVESDTARLVTLLAPGTAEAFFHATGQAADAPTLPPPAEPDLPALLAGMNQYGIEFVGPPPART